MKTPRGLAAARRAFAKQMLASVGASDDARLERAFADTPREAFLGAPPWLITRGVGYTPVPDDPALLYQDVLVALKADKSLNNGSPSLHAHWLHAARVQIGERVVHIGAGGGYYTAILSRLAGARGRVAAVEFDPDLAAAAAAHLASYGNVTLVQGDGALWPREPADLVYVNFAVDRPASPWLERLKPQGRLIFPLGTIARRPGAPSYGLGLRVERVGDDGVYAARSLGGAYFVRAEGDGRLLAEGAEREALLAAFESGALAAVRSLRWRVAASPRALFVGDGWSLGADPPAIEAT